MLPRKLVLHGKTRKLWQADIDGAKLRIVHGSASKLPAPTEKDFGDRSYGKFDAALEALRKAQLTRLRGGYVLDGPQGALIRLLAIEGDSAAALSPDGERLFCLKTDASSCTSTLRIRVPATGEVLFEQALSGHFVAHDLHVLSWDRALVAAGIQGVVEIDAGGARRTLALDRTNVYGIGGGGDRVVAITQEGAFLLDAGDGRVVARAPAETSAVSVDGSLWATCGKHASEIVVHSGVDGRELTRVSLGDGQGARTLAIAPGRLVAGGIYLPAASRHTSWAWTLPDGRRALTALFSELNQLSSGQAVFCADGALIAVSSHEIYQWSDGTRRLQSDEVGGSKLQASADGRWLLSLAERAGVVAVWDTAALLRGEGGDELALRVQMSKQERAAEPPPVRLPALPEAPVAVSPEGSFTLPLGAHASSRAIPAGAVYESFVNRATTLLDVSTGALRFSRRGQAGNRCARSHTGTWLVCDLDGLWLTRDFAVQGDRLTPPLDPAAVGWLGGAPAVFDFEGEVVPQVYEDGAWIPVQGLDMNGARTIVASYGAPDGSSTLCFRNVAYAVERGGRARRLFDLGEVYTFYGLALPDGRLAMLGPAGVHLLKAGQPRKIIPVEPKKYSLCSIAPGPRGRLLVGLHRSPGRSNSELAGALVGLDGRVTPLPKALFGVESTVTLNDLLACGDRLVARIEHGDEFRVCAAPPG